MKILFVNGSPRAQGNTGTMLRSLAKKAEGNGAEVNYLELGEMNVQDCDGCYRCDVEDRCLREDDMQGAYGLFREADMVIIGSPIYMGAETGITKCFMDRLYYLMSKKDERTGRRAAVFFTCGLVEGHMVYGYMYNRYHKLLSDDLGFDDVRTFIVSGMKHEVNVDENYYAQDTLKEIEGFMFPAD
ncbi:MAG: flavodoxin family protein [Methanomassiliicoccales archaeon]|nr:flavodoxin family protein [Methanomassiliicoccales archaeon]